MASPPLKRFWDTSWSPCTLDQESCLNLDEITGSFSAPITEEHAWAIVFECLKCLRSVVREAKNRRILIVSHTDQILIHREGRVHESTFLPTTSNSSSCHESCKSHSVWKSPKNYFKNSWNFVYIHAPQCKIHFILTDFLYKIENSNFTLGKSHWKIRETLFTLKKNFNFNEFFKKSNFTLKWDSFEWIFT